MIRLLQSIRLVKKRATKLTRTKQGMRHAVHHKKHQNAAIHPRGKHAAKRFTDVTTCRAEHLGTRASPIETKDSRNGESLMGPA
ncbi:hypothetical protein ACQUJT_02995 [Ralstonia pseudosolanacearum]|uniref:hypothetical protein n=1 Tax=Ralstonia solanacearum species complex TaxID=3116862 RepID=UPI001FFAD203|nr:hypothetical protein [Ralstonia pseudosolanacearum]